MKPSNIIIIIIMFFSFMSNNSTNFDKRTVIISNNKFVIRAEVSITKTIKIKKLKDKLEYTWYYNNTIKTSKGNYSGKLLDGKYEMFDLKNNLLIKGQFNLGLKQGRWYYWLPNGQLKKIIEYKNGVIHGDYISYKEITDEKWVSIYRNNKIKKTLQYKNKKFINKIRFDRKGDTIKKREFCKFFRKDTTTVIIDNNNNQDTAKNNF